MSVHSYSQLWMPRLDIAAMRRPLQPTDFASLKAAHSDTFPIDYEDSFFEAAVNGRDGIFSWVATVRCAGAGPCTVR